MTEQSEHKAVAVEKTKTYGWDENIRTILYAIAIALIFRSFLFEPFHIPSSSMKDNLLIGDYIFVSKYSYGYGRYSFPLGLPLFEGRILNDDRPERGDVVVFRLPSNPKVDYIKRVIGLPGDSVQVIDGIVYINDLPVTLERAGSFDDTLPDGTIQNVRRYLETLPNAKTHSILDTTRQGEQDNTFAFKVPEKHYFMMGDNRDNSMDSRYDLVGFVPEENLIGRAEIIFFSIDDATSLWKVWDWFWAFRGERLLKEVE